MLKKLTAVGVAAALSFASWSAVAEVTLRVFAGGGGQFAGGSGLSTSAAGQRPDLLRQALDIYEKRNPGVKVVAVSGGATADQQRQYVSTLFNAKDASIDALLIDNTIPKQFMAAGWIEPLDPYLGPASTVMQPYMPVYAKLDVVDGKIAALPGYADAMYLFYRKDLLEKHHIAEPKTWTDLAAAAQSMMNDEHDPALQGLSIQGAPIEGAVCTFLLPYWSQGKELTDAAGRLTLDKTAAVAGMKMWTSMMDTGVIKKNVAEVTTADTTNEFMAGHAIFAVDWAYGWNTFGSNPASAVKGKVGVMQVPAMSGGKSVTCIGGWQWAVSAFSNHKAESAKLIRYLSSPEVTKTFAAGASLLPVFPANYRDADVLAANPWFKTAGDVIEQTGRVRPMTTRYGEVSDIIRTTTSAMLGRSIPVDAGVDQIDAKLRRVFH